MRRQSCLALVPCLLCLLVGAARGAGIERVSLDTLDQQMMANSHDCAISADGRFVAFSACPVDPARSWAACYQIWVRDRQHGTTVCVSTNYQGQPGNADSFRVSLSADGRFVAFSSRASDLVLGDTNEDWDVFVRDRQTGTTERVSVGHESQQGDGGCFDGVISADGRFVAFVSYASNLVPGDGNSTSDVFVRNRETGALELVSVSDTGEQDNIGAMTCAINADGRYVAFRSNGSTLVPGDSNQAEDVFVRDRALGSTERVNVGSLGEEANGPCYDDIAISADGRFVVFKSVATNLVPNDSNDAADIFLRDRAGGITELISVNSAGEQAPNDCSGAAVSADGRFVVFAWAPGVTVEPTDWNIFVRDRQSKLTLRVSVDPSGEPANRPSSYFAITPDGRYIAFVSEASNLVPDDTNGCMDVFLRDVLTFDDLSFDYWAFPQIKACADAAVVSGYSDATYHPAELVSRDQMAAYLARALAGGDGNVPPGPAAASFQDVAADHWAYRYVEYAVSQSVVQGYDPTHYQPDLPVDRGQMAVFVARAKGWVKLGEDMTVAPQLFPDVPAGFWAGAAIEACVDDGVVEGYDDGYYRPDAQVTRDQMAVYVARAFALQP
jgi:Tol biopolymer transport system component